MLVELRIKNFAIINALNLDFDPGLVILTGETGAGKSIIMGALDMLLGQRVDMSTLRKGSDFASVEAVFRIPDDVRDPVMKILKEEDLVDGTEFLTLTRELRKDKRNIARVNGHITNAAVLVGLGQYLVDIHGQSEHLSLMRVNQHLGLLDRFSGTTEHLDEYQKIYHQIKETQNTLTNLRRSDLEADQRKELLAFQIEEISLAAPQVGEEEPLIELRNRLVNAEKLADLGQKILILLDDAPAHQPTVLDLVGQIVSSMEVLSKTDPTLEIQNQRTLELSDGFSELGKELRSYLEMLEFDADELEKTQDRLVLLHELKRKYGETISDILNYLEQARQQLEEITGRGTLIGELEEVERGLLTKLGKAGQKLTKGRKTGAQRLTSELEIQLDDLKMTGSRFEVSFVETESKSGAPIPDGKTLEFYPDGLEKIEFLIETNPGEGLKALAKTASGGETARLMLALKNVLAKADHISTLVFDEIDQGIGGRIGAVVGEKLYRLTPEHQVICITHLPQLAGFGQQHFQVLKGMADGRTTIQVQEISGEDRVKELATMLGGPSDKNLESVREMMDYISKVIQ